MLRNEKIKLKEKGELYLRIKAAPGAAKTAIKEVMADATIKMNIAAAPEGGRANRELIRFLAEEFGVPKDKVKILSGAASRLKLVKINLK